jgi:NAD(P)H-hydrate epimerase
LRIPYLAPGPLTCEQIRQIDRAAIEGIGMPGVILMENAGRAAAEFVYSILVDPGRSRVLILCGPGNNGGDGFVVARHLHNAGVNVTVALSVPVESLRGDAAINARIVQQMPLRLLRAYEPAGMEEVTKESEKAEVIVDALLGTGSSGAPRGAMRELIEIANAAARARRIAIDLPSGLDGDTGQPASPCFRADATITMVAPKAGFATPLAQPYVGRVVVVDIGVPRELVWERRGGGA